MLSDHLQYSPTWIHRFLRLASHIASWSKDPSTQVGAVIVHPVTRVILGLGYNGFPRSVEDHPDRLNNRPVKYSMIVHAEVNAILNASTSVRGAFLFLTYPPCNECAKLIIQSGIERVYAYKTTDERWLAAIATTQTMFDEAGVMLYILERHNDPV